MTCAYYPAQDLTLKNRTLTAPHPARNKKTRRRLMAVLAGTAFYAALLALGAQPDMATTLGLGLLPDKVLHATAYGAIAGLLYLGLPQPPLLRSAWVVAIIALLGAVDETLQAALPHRQADVMDWLADLAGAVVTCILFSMARRLHHRSHHSNHRRQAASVEAPE